MSLLSREKKSLRQIAHHLDAVVIVGDQGVSEGVVQETERALVDHELIKVKLAMTDREERRAAAESLATTCNAEVVQSIGKVIVLYRENTKASPKLSNIQRYR
jgi:RNA-binding protein